MQRRKMHAVPLVDGDVGLAEYIQQCPVVGRMSDGVEAVEALRVEETRVGAVSDEQVDDLHQAVARGPLQRRGDKGSPDCVDFGTLLDEIRARLESAIDCSPV
jgi:hypothetical protein